MRDPYHGSDTDIHAFEFLVLVAFQSHLIHVVLCVSRCYAPVDSARNSRVNSNAANVLAAEGMLLSNDGDRPRKSPVIPDSDIIVLISLFMYCQGLPVGGTWRC